VLSRNATSNCRFAGTAPAADPLNVPELLLKRLGVRSQLVSFSLHASTLFSCLPILRATTSYDAVP
jgi:hypothetical protein